MYTRIRDMDLWTPGKASIHRYPMCSIEETIVFFVSLLRRSLFLRPPDFEGLLMAVAVITVCEWSGISFVLCSSVNVVTCPIL